MIMKIIRLSFIKVSRLQLSGPLQIEHHRDTNMVTRTKHTKRQKHTIHSTNKLTRTPYDIKIIITYKLTKVIL
jgi:hypothetical protein